MLPEPVDVFTSEYLGDNEIGEGVYRLENRIFAVIEGFASDHGTKFIVRELPMPQQVQATRVQEKDKSLPLYNLSINHLSAGDIDGIVESLRKNKMSDLAWRITEGL